MCVCSSCCSRPRSGQPASSGKISPHSLERMPKATTHALRLLTLERDPSEVAGEELATGHELLARCEQALGEQPGPRDSSAASTCRSVVRGVFDMTGLTRTLQVCSPADVTVIQAVRVVVRYLDAHHDELHEGDTTLVLRALRNTFPCQ